MSHSPMESASALLTPIDAAARRAAHCIIRRGQRYWAIRLMSDPRAVTTSGLPNQLDSNAAATPSG